MLMDVNIDTDRTAFICPECSFNGTSLPELISHLNEAHGEETVTKSEAPSKTTPLMTNEKRSRRKPAFSHQIISQASRSSLPVFKQNNIEPGSIQFWNRAVTADKNDRLFTEPNNVIRKETSTNSNVGLQRPIAPKSVNTPPKPISSNPIVSTPPFYAPAIQPIQKNFQCRICHLTYKNFHDCTAHIRRKHEISHAQAGRYVGKLDTNAPLPPSATGHYKIRLKVKSLPPQPIPSTTTPVENFTKTYHCKHCSYKSTWLKDVSQHEIQAHNSYSSYTHENTINDNNNHHDNNGLSALLVDSVQSYGEVLSNENDDMIMIEDDADDDEDEALWKYQQEINNLSDSSSNARMSLVKSFKKFQCPHCEHNSPTLTKLKLHVATHINIKPYMCSICGWRANLRWYIQCHARKRHPSQNFEVLQLSHEEAEQTINAYMRERAFDTNMHSRHDSKHQYQCSLCQFRSNHPRYIEQHIEANHTKTAKPSNHQTCSNHIDTNTHNTPNSSNVAYANFSSHPNFNPNRFYYCSLCYRGYRWRYDVKRHHKTMHEAADDESLKGRNFQYLEYIPHIDSLITATMSSINNQIKHDNDIEDDDDEEGDLKINATDTKTFDTMMDQPAKTALTLVKEPEKSVAKPIVVDSHHEDSVIVFDDDRAEKSSSNEIVRSSSRPSFKPYRCPYCFYRTNWRTDCLRHIRARHKVEPSQNGYYEMPYDEAEKTYDEYERTFGFVVSKKVLARYTDFRQIKWEDLKQSIWEKIKDKTEFEQCIYDRLRPNSYTSNLPVETPTQPLIVTIPNKTSLEKSRRMFACTDCAFRSSKIHELDKHTCTKRLKLQHGKSHRKCVVSLYECTKCSYRTVNKSYIRQHIHYHRLKYNNKHAFYYCSFCGHNHRYRTKIIVHIAKKHPRRTLSNCLRPSYFACDADYTIRQSTIRRSFIEEQLKTSSTFHCIHCPYVSITMFDYEHHRSYHSENSLHPYKCQHCSFASNSLLYTGQHSLIHSKSARSISSESDLINLKQIPISTLYKEILGKCQRYKCPFCEKFASSFSSAVLYHIKKTHASNNNHFGDSLAFGSDVAKEILFLNDNVLTKRQLGIN